MQAFEPRLTAELFARWPDRVAEVLGHDEERAWLLLADAGTPIGVFGNPPEAWLVALPLYAELQRGEAARAHEHLTHHVPDLRIATLPARYEDLLQHDLPFESNEMGRLREFKARFAELCSELTAHDVPETVQHDDLHMSNVYAQGERLRLLDWGDASISHPFHTLRTTLAIVANTLETGTDDPSLLDVRDAYLSEFGDPVALKEPFELAQRTAAVTNVLTWAPFVEAMLPAFRKRYGRSIAEDARMILDVI